MAARGTSVDEVKIDVGGAGAPAGGAAGAALRTGAPLERWFTMRNWAACTNSHGSLKVQICTWNVGNKQPSQNFAPWIPVGGGGADIVVVGLQESTYKVKSAANAADGAASPADDEPSDDEEEEEGGDDETPYNGENRPTSGSSTAAGSPKPAKASGAAASGSGAGAALSPEMAGWRSPAGKPLSDTHLVQMIQLHLTNAYELLAEATLLEMRILVFGHARIHAAVSDVESFWEATGALGVWGNKGGLGVRLSVHGTSMCFISTHLAAHQGQKYLIARNNHASEILRNLRMGDKNVDVDSQFDHIFWMGDLNYRVSLDIADGKARDNDAHWAEIHGLVQARQFAKLAQADQLRQQMSLGRVLVGFQEGQYNFPPTFKVERTPGFSYKKQRFPSYCDRILWKSMPGTASLLRQTSLAAHPEIATSDHKPVSSTFQITCTPPFRFTRDAPRFRIVITGLSGANLFAADPNGQSDPYVVFRSHPAGLLAGPDGNKPLRTPYAAQTLSPTWSDDKVPSLPIHLDNIADVGRCSLLFCVMDYDAMSADDSMGQAVLGLAPFITAKAPTPFRAPVLHGGVPFGEIKGSIQIVAATGKSARAATGGGAGCCTIQ